MSIFAQSPMRGVGQPIGVSWSSAVNPSQVKGTMQNAGDTNGGSRGSGSFGGDIGSYQIHVLGQINSPGTYHVAPSTRLDEGIGLAGGSLDRGSRRLVEIRRGNQIKHYDLLKFRMFGDVGQNPFLLDNDVIFVPYAQTNVAIQGAIKSNGVYELTTEKNIWDVIQLAGGFTVGVSQKDPVTVVRFVNGEKTLLTVLNSEEDLKLFSPQNGDIIVIPHIFGENRRPDYNFPELPADNVFYPTQATVYVVGGVATPGPYAFNPNYTLRDYIAIASPTKLARPTAAYVMTRDGKHIKKPEKNKDFRISLGDTIVVPERQVTIANTLSWYNTTLSTIFSFFVLKDLANRF